MLTNFNIEKIKRILGNIFYQDEVEIIFNHHKINKELSIIDFINILKYMKLRSNNENLKAINETSLDIFFNDEMNNKYEISINGIKDINDFVNKYCQYNNNYLILYTLLTENFITTNNLKYIKKTSDIKDIYYIDRLDINIHKSIKSILSYNDIKEILNLIKSPNISYRLRNTSTLFIIDNKNELVSINLSRGYLINNLNEIWSSKRIYKLGINYSLKKNNKISNDISEKIIKEIEIIRKVLLGIKYFIGINSNIVTESYKKLIFINDYFRDTAL